jgi:hypothetical protein
MLSLKSYRTSADRAKSTDENGEPTEKGGKDFAERDYGSLVD